MYLVQRGAEIPARQPSGSDESRRSTESIIRRIIHTGFPSPLLYHLAGPYIILRVRPGSSIPEKFCLILDRSSKPNRCNLYTNCMNRISDFHFNEILHIFFLLYTYVFCYIHHVCIWKPAIRFKIFGRHIYLAN